MTNNSIYSTNYQPISQYERFDCLVSKGILKKYTKEQFEHKKGNPDSFYAFEYLGVIYIPINEVVDYIEQLIFEFVEIQKKVSSSELYARIENLLTIKCATKTEKIDALKDLKE